MTTSSRSAGHASSSAATSVSARTARPVERRTRRNPSPHLDGVDYSVLDNLVGFALRRAQVVIHDDFSTSLEDEGITPPRFSALVVIARNRGLKQNELAEIMGIAPSGAFKTIEALERLDLIERQSVENDKRAYALSLTKHGNKKLREFIRRVTKHDRRVTASLNESEREQLMQLLGRLVPTA